jgi:hypothetical protein
MEPVSSVTAFLALYGEDGAGDAQAAEVLAALDEEERRALSVPGARSRVTDAGAARRQHARRRAEIRLRRELQRRGLWRD